MFSLQTLAGLMRDPTRRLVKKYLDDQETDRRADRKAVQERAAIDRELRRLELKNRHGQGLSEEESNGSYAEPLARQVGSYTVTGRELRRAAHPTGRELCRAAHTTGRELRRDR
jgi:hypothetical protein